MLTICIPVYNQRVYPLVKTLFNQITPYDGIARILIIDDGSQKIIVEQNNKECQSLATIIELSKNVGRAKIRNLFVKYTDNPFLLFLDCDVVIKQNDFVKKYMNLIHTKNIDVVSGGHKYSDCFPGRKYSLRWKFGVKREGLSINFRQQHAYKSFKTSNFLISRNIFNKVQFNESLSGYGHEDTLFGFELKCNHIPILHVDNPVIIENVDTNQDFIAKTNQSINNLSHILQLTNNHPEIIKDITLLKVHKKLSGILFGRFLLTLFRWIYPALKTLLIKGFGSLRIFDIYKLAYLSKIKKDNLMLEQNHN